MSNNKNEPVTGTIAETENFLFLLNPFASPSLSMRPLTPAMKKNMEMKDM